MRRWAAIVVFVLVAGCAQAPSATPSSSVNGATSAGLVAVTPQAVGALIERHFGTAYALTGSEQQQVAVQPTEWVDGIGATAYYRATPGVSERVVTVSYSPAPLPVISCPSATCTMKDGAYLRTPQFGTPDILAPRAAGFVQVRIEAGVELSELPAEAVALAADSRIGAQVDPALGDAANPRWRTDDLGCGDAKATGLVPLPAADAATKPATPQAMAAVIASRVVTGCVGGRTTSDGVAATAYLGADTERVELAVTTAEPPGHGLDAYETRGKTRIGWQFDVPAEYPAKVQVWHRAATGGWVVVTHTSMHADPATREFPVPLETLIGIATDQQVGLKVNPALNRAGDELPLRWRLAATTAE